MQDIQIPTKVHPQNRMPTSGMYTLYIRHTRWHRCESGKHNKFLLKVGHKHSPLILKQFPDKNCWKQADRVHLALFFHWNLTHKHTHTHTHIHTQTQKWQQNSKTSSGWGEDVAQLVEYQTATPLRQVQLPSTARDFSPRVNFQCRLSYGVCTPLCATTCINIGAYVKDPVVHVRVWWISKTLKHLVCTEGWVALLHRCWLSPGKATWISHGRNPDGTIQL